MIKQWLVGVALVLSADLAMAAKTCPLSIEGNDLMKFNVTELKVPADCTEVELTLKHAGKLPKQTMGHNWVLTKTSDYTAVANAGMAAGLDKDYLPADDKRIIAHTKVVGGGESTSVKFPVSKLTKGGDYTFFCSFPGHYGLMHGKFVY
ncbi:MAG TPA: azurin [Steroidobacteraceae bacterium]|jgi:azurin|nr:azurin [Steroidobacteraceae bacterium]